ncbi:MAG TPA: HAD-IC family P-type ATPase, partial [Kofleriaceae bacterium]|nr:HAD-IC family P-type ATPase [Kofleriaceae bacterium]
LIASGVSALASVVWRRPPIEIVRDTVALGVAAIPEGLPMTSNAALVRAMARMRERGVIVRRLGTAEALGGITVACTDKTGTLTENRMRLATIWIDGRRIDASAISMPRAGPAGGPIAALLAAAVLNSDLDYHRNGGALHVAGSSTEQALARAAIGAGLDPEALRERFPRRRLIERDEHARYVISEHRCHDGSSIAFAKGAPEQVVELCGCTEAAAVLAENAELGAAGLRVLAVASRNGGDRWRLLGLVALRDPLRPGAADAVRGAADAGIRTVILTGDQRATAAAIADQVGLRGEVIEGSELPAVLADPERLRRIAVVARVAPRDKVAVIEGLRAAGEIVAMAGDGINDAPALKAADVGIAVGVRSTDLARQTADVVLERDDLRSIIAAIGEGRIVQDNLRRAVRFQVAGNLGEVLLITGGALAGRRLISPLGLLWINLLTDSLPALALALEPGKPDVLARPPAPPAAPILDRGDWRRIARDGAAIAGVSGLAAIAGGPLAAFATVGAVQFGYAAMCRTQDRVRRDRMFGRMIGGSAALHLAAVVVTPIRRLLRLGGSLPVALASFGLAIGAPLYLASRAGPQLEITRRGHSSRKDPSP